MNYLLNYNRLQELPNGLVALFFFGPLLAGILFYLYKTRHARLWRKGIFPSSLLPNDDNFLEAYLALGAKMMLFNYQETKGKVQFINHYFKRYFSKATYNFGDSLLFSLRYPIQSKTITDWMNTHLKEEGARSQVIYFLTGLALVAGNVNSRELNFLKEINKALHLSPENLTKILAIYASYQAHSKEQSDPKRTQPFNKAYYYEILGLSVGADQTSIKKAYRTLVKIHHPDNFASGTTSQQKMAAEKFIEIQRAYEALTSH
jgi:DnaJ like chaperone protein